MDSASVPLDVALIVGTRPEAIKLIPVLFALREQTDLKTELWLTGQHTSMVQIVLDSFGVKADLALESPNPSGTLSALTGVLLTSLSAPMSLRKPRCVVVQGDTTSAFVAALVAFYHQIKVAHVEAGLRTHNKFAPFPEEINRSLISPLADLHFPPTETSAANLMREGISADRVEVTGNTVIDALLMMVEKVRTQPPVLPESFPLKRGTKTVLITGHRRENFGDGFLAICEAIKELSLKFPTVSFVYPVHLNRNVQEPVMRILSDLQNVHLTEPLDYKAFVWAMDKSDLILSDSGGVQEEAPSLGKPVLVMRDTTERPEAIEAGTSRLVGTDKTRIVSEVSLLLESKKEYDRMSRVHNPFGDGKASTRIAAALVRELAL